MSKLFSEPVMPIVEGRSSVSRIIARFRAEGEAAEPVVLGSHRKAEAVLMSYQRYQRLLNRQEPRDSGRAARARAAAAAHASVQAENPGPYSPAAERAREDWIAGRISGQEVRQRLLKHWTRR